jgi:hypothetical protein
MSASMNPEAVEYLESLGDQHPKHFTPAFPFNGSFASIKEDHEQPGRWCPLCESAAPGELIVIEEEA